MKLNEIITRYRQEHDMSQRAFALKCGVTNGYISMIENGTNPTTGKPIVPTVDKLKKIAEGMGLSLQQLFDMVDDMPVEVPPKAKRDPLDPLISKLRMLDEIELIKVDAYIDGLISAKPRNKEKEA